MDGALLGVEILEVICRKYIPQLIKKLLISCLTKTNSVLTVLTLPRVVLICSVTSVPTLERSHTLVQNVGGVLLSLQVAVDIMKSKHSTTNKEIASLEVRQSKLYQCSHCSYSTKNCCEYKHHVYTHTGEKPYTCKKCGRSFAQSSTYYKHMRRVHSEKTSASTP